MSEEIRFEEALEKLRKLSEEIRSSETTLEGSIRCFEEGMKYYAICKDTLDQAKQKIETYQIEE